MRSVLKQGGYVAEAKWGWVKYISGLGQMLMLNLPASVYRSPTFSSSSLGLGGGQIAWSRPGVLSSLSVGEQTSDWELEREKRGIGLKENTYSVCEKVEVTLTNTA